MTTLQTIAQNEAQKEVIINQNFVALSKGAVLGYKPTVSGLRYYYYGGMIRTRNGAIFTVPDGFVTCVAGNNYVQFNTLTNSVITNTTGFIDGNIPMALVSGATSNLTAIVDNRPEDFGIQTKRLTSLNNITLSTTYSLILPDILYNIQNTGTEYIWSVKLICTTANANNLLNEELSGYVDVGSQKVSIDDISFLDKTAGAIKIAIPASLYVFNKTSLAFDSIATLANYKLLIKVH